MRVDANRLNRADGASGAFAARARRSLTALALGGLALAGFQGIGAPAGAAQPALSRAEPPGAQRGVETSIVFRGARLQDAEEVIFTGTGVQVTKITAAAGDNIIANVLIAPDAELGPREFHIRTRSGLTGMQLFSVGALPNVAEVEPNNKIEEAQKIALNVTVNGIVQGEEVDYYAFEAAEGQRINFEIEGLRLGTSVLDPQLTLFDPTGREIAAVDDTPLLGQDAAFGFVAPTAGVYRIQAREASYGGGGDNWYRLHVGTFPRPSGVFPPGGKPGQEIDAKWLGDAKTPDGKAAMPAQAGMRGLFPAVDGAVPPSGVPVRVSDLENFIEAEPNNELAAATPVTIPGAFNGVIGEPGDVDRFVFDGVKGQVFDVQLYGRRLRSPLDSVVTFMYADGRGIAADDDAVKPDSYMRITVPEDGKFALLVQDQLARGGPDFLYRLEVAPIEVGVSVVPYMPGQRDVQSLQLPIGNRMAYMLSVRRKDMGGDMKLTAENLPPGVTVELGDCPNGVGDIPVLFTADPATTSSGRLVDLVVKPADENVKVVGHMDETIEHIRILNNVPVLLHQMKALPAAVVEKAPFSIEVTEPKVPILRNGVMNLLVKATRAEGYVQPINLRMMWNPPGISSAVATIAADKTTTTLQVTAAGNAGVGDWKIAVIASAAYVDSSIEVSSQLLKLAVAEPWINIGFEKSRTDQGTETQIVGALTIAHPFEGEATVTLLGMPPSTVVEPIKITKDTTAVTYKVKVGADTPPTKYNGMVAQAVITDQGEPITLNIGGLELRVDKPLGTPAPTPPPPAADGAPAPTPAPPPAGPQRGDRKPAKGIAPFNRAG